MEKKKLDKRSKLKPFLKVVNYNHVMPTRCAAFPSCYAHSLLRWRLVQLEPAAAASDGIVARAAAASARCGLSAGSTGSGHAWGCSSRQPR